MMKVLVTGGKGMLATELVRALKQSEEHDVLAPGREQLDVTDRAGVRDAVGGARPDLVIHTAAMHVDACEEDPKEAFWVNAWATRGLAQACDLAGCELVYISTCGLFGDEVRAYSEYDPVVLKTAYARSKYEGEIAVRECAARHYIVRPGWLFGGDPAHRKNFVARRYEEAQANPVVRSANDKLGSPTYTGDLANRILEIAATSAYGTYHVANGGGATRVEYVRQILTCFGVTTTVEEVDSSYYPRKADVPGCEILETRNCEYLGLPELEPWDQAVARYVRQLKASTQV
jgi:dTDP-4-dehydrorhamnose reductase